MKTENNPAPAQEKEKPDELGRELARMVTDYVEGGLRLGTNWRNGLAEIITHRLKRLAARPAQNSVDINMAMQCLMSDHIQNNKHRLGALGATDLHDAIVFLKENSVAAQKGAEPPFNFSPWIPPFRYDHHGSRIVDSKDHFVADMRGWGFLIGQREGRLQFQDRLGEQIAKSLNATAVPPVSVEEEKA